MAKKLLLIEYEPRYIDKVRLAGGSDFDVTVAKEGDEGIAAFDRERPDLVVVTAALQKVRVNDVIRDLRRKGGPTAPPILLMMSGYKGSNPKADAQKIGAFDILEKPFSDDTFRSLAFEALESSDPGARTMRIDASQLQGGLTSSDIFSDVLEDLQPEEPKKPAAPIPDAARPAAASTGVDKRLEDTLSGILTPKKPAAPPPPPARPVPAAPPVPKPAAVPPPMPAPAAAARAAAPEPARAAPRASTNLEVDNMISQTLAGMTIPAARPKPAAPAPPAPPPPAPKPVPAPVAAAPPPAPRKPAERPSSPPPPSDKDRFGQFQLIEKIATGGMAEVYKARMSGVEGFQKIVAIKKILPHMAASDDFMTMFADEAKLAAQLNHPNIIHIYDLGKVDKSYYIAMEYVEGRDLRSILKSGAEHGLPLPPELALFIASKLAAALDYAHRRKDFNGDDLSLVHRDVSPQNVLISYEGDIKLCDFGIAKAASKSSQTQAGALKGKLQYMSPEQASGKTLDRRSDLFSLGSVLYEMLTGEKLFAGESDMTILDQVRNVKAQPPSSKNPDVPKRVDSIVLKALAKSPEDRYQNASDLQRDLESVLYTFSPAPGSADLAIFMHHLQAEEKGAAAESDRAFDAAFAPAKPEAAAPPAKSKKAKGTVVQRKTGTVPGVPVPPAPAPAAPSEAAGEAPSGGIKQETKSGVFGAYSSKRIDAEKKGRAPLVAGIGVAALVLVGVIVAVTRKRAPAPPKPVAAAPAAPATTAAAPATSSAANTTLTEKQVEDEVKKQLAQKQKELEKAQAAQKKNAKAAPATTAAAPTAAGTPPAAPPPPAVAANTIKPAPMPVAITPAAAQPAPISAPKRIETAAPAPAPPVPEPAAAAVARGDLVGPGPGVVEPELASRLSVNYPLAARQERVSGRVVILALVDENGVVQSARVQSGVASRSGVNQAIVDAVKKARFRPATKDGVPVKMYKAIPVDVTP
jgi:TonB family protein